MFARPKNDDSLMVPKHTRRRFLQRGSILLNAACVGGMLPRKTTTVDRDYQVCLNPDIVESDPDLLTLLERSGISTIWLAGFFYGHWPYSLERLKAAKGRIEAKGISAQVINLPFGHPGDSLGSSEGDFPLTPPPHWSTALRYDGKTYVGTSLHSPAVRENRRALKRLLSQGFRSFFLDDDFRLARGPGEIGGCFCRQHQEKFLHRCGFRAPQWAELLQDVTMRRLTPLLRSWVDFHGEELSRSFKQQEAAVGKGRLGAMVMYLGAEKAGLRLPDYAQVPFRVGELMFSDKAFRPEKGKTDELFSILFHRRFARPELAYSETTAFPAEGLSVENMAAKLVLSTIADVRHTMFMSGLRPFPRTYWEVLAPAMCKQSRLHAKLAGHKPYGPFKHYWGEASRYVGKDRPFSLWLAAGVPFETTETLSTEGWTFLSEEDASDLIAGRLKSPGTQCVVRSETVAQAPIIMVPESLEPIFAFKKGIAAHLSNIPHVPEPVPVICAWYPTADAVLVWNLSYRTASFTVQWAKNRWPLTLEPLDCALLEKMNKI